MFKNNEGQEVRGTLIKLTRNSVVFEIYKPYSVTQVSEVLRDIQIHRGEHSIYQGKAVVFNLINTGLMTIVSATLVDPWPDLTEILPGQELRNEVKHFIHSWEKTHKIILPAYSLSLNNLSDFLREFSLWMQQVETISGINEPDTPMELIQEFLGDIEKTSLPKLNELFMKFDEEARKVPKELSMFHDFLCRKKLHPFMLCSPFLHRTYTKPLGYAGDYEMVNMMFHNRWQGQNSYAKMINSFSLQSDTVQAHRNRIAILVQRLEEETRTVTKKGQKIHILNIGCGPAIEIQRFLKDSWLSDKCVLELIDFNPETLAYTENKISAIIKEKKRQTEIKFTQKSIHRLLVEASKKEQHPERFDFIYCAGLFDYLSDKICERLIGLFYRWLRPEGLLLVTNVHTSPLKDSLNISWNGTSSFGVKQILKHWLTYRIHHTYIKIRRASIFFLKYESQHRIPDYERSVK